MGAAKVSLCRTAGGVLLALFLAGTTPARGGVVMDGSLGPAGALAGPNYAIGANLGHQVGGNLFHSFSAFSLTAAESATFSGPGSVSNIISRVTGGSPSAIDGRVASTIPGANFFFLNPAGIVFGPNATLDVGGSAHFSTASHLSLGDGGLFAASADAAASTLTAAEPAAFGFLGRGAPIEVRGAALSVGPGATLGLEAGDILIDGAALSASGGSVDLTAQGGVYLVDSAVWTVSAGEVPPGRISIVGGEIVMERSGVGSYNFSDQAAAPVALATLGGDLQLENAAVESAAYSFGTGGGIRLDARNIGLSGSSILSRTAAFGRGGDIELRASESILAYGASSTNLGSQIYSISSGWGDAGDVLAVAGEIGLMEGAQIGSLALGAGNGGFVGLLADHAILVAGSDAGGFSSGVISESHGTGAAGDVAISTIDLSLLDGGTVVASTYGTMPGAGMGGSIFGEVRGRATVSGVSASGRPSGIEASTTGTGDAGFISIEAGEMRIRYGGKLVSATEHAGPDAGWGGYIRLAVAGDLEIAGNGPGGEKSMITANTQGGGAAGFISIAADRVALSEGGQIMSSTFSPAAGAGDSGTVSIKANALSISGQGANGVREPSGIYTESSGTGDAGFIFLDLGRLDMSAGGRISSSSFGTMPGAGAGGFISAMVSGPATLSGSGEGGQNTIIKSDTHGPGWAGYISFKAGDLALVDGGQIVSTAFGTMNGAGSGGYLALDVANATLITGVGANGLPSALSAETHGTGYSGSVNLNTGSLILSNGGAISSGAYGTGAGAGSGGDIRIVAREDVRVAGVNEPGRRTSGIFSDSTGPGAAGRIAVEARRVELADGGFISSSAFGSEAAGGWGRIEVTAAESLRILGTRQWGNGTIDRSGIFTNTEGEAFAGDIVIETPRLEVRDGGLIASGSLGQMPGARGEGRIDVLAGSVLLSGVGPDGNPSMISTQSEGPGRAGDVTVFADSLELGGGARISSASYGQGPDAGNGGGVFINAGRIVLTGRRPDGTPTGINAESSGPGLAGNIDIVAANALVLAGGAEIATSASEADGGNIALKVGRLLQLTDSRITTSVGSGFGNGGNIDIDPVFTVLNNSVIQANAYGGNGGNIRIVTDHLTASSDSRIEASSQLGIDGSVEISTPNVDVGSGLTVLPGNYLDATLFLRDACAGRAAGTSSSFVGVGRGGLPQSPGGLLTSRYDELLPVRTATLHAVPRRLTFACGRHS
jgi:filamentous hemagglutinin family protein